MNLSELIISSVPFTGEFDYDHYPSNFEKFKAGLSSVLEETEPEHIDGLVTDTINDIDAYISTMPRRAGSAARHDIKQVLALFAVPAADMLGEKGTALGSAFLSQWNGKYKKYSFIRGNFEAIMRGFDANLLGLPLRKSKFNRRKPE